MEENIWFNKEAEEQDVAVLTRVNLLRNLASFPFPVNCKIDEQERIQSIIFDAFNKIKNSKNFQSTALKNIKSNGLKILSERGFCPVGKANTGAGIVTSLDGSVSCLINDVEHLKISTFASGLNLQKTYEDASALDFDLQDFVQFAASKNFGYLCSNIFNTGSGLHASVRFHLPSLSYSGEIKDVIKEVQSRGFIFADCFGVGNFFNSSIGAYYDVSTVSCFNGNEIDLLASMASVAKYIFELERKKRQFFADNKSTVVHNIIVRAYSILKFALMIDLRECIDLISCIKWGVDLGYIKGVSDVELNALLYNVQSGHLNYLLESSNFSFEEDISNDDELKENRLRATVVKKIIEKIKFVS